MRIFISRHLDIVNLLLKIQRGIINFFKQLEISGLEFPKSLTSGINFIRKLSHSIL